MNQAFEVDATNCRVEVSGWDARESFFVEKTVLYSDNSRQEISLRSRLQEGAVIFVRLMQPYDCEENFPAPYIVARNLPIEIDGRVTVAISQQRPKPSYRQQSAENLNDAHVN